MKEKNEGQGMVEFALILPLILLLIIGIANLFYLFAVVDTLHDAVSEGGREAQVWRPGGGTFCVGRVTEGVIRISPFFDPDRDTVVVSENCTIDPFARIPSGNEVYVGVIIYWEPFFFSTLFKDQWSPPITIPLATDILVRHE